MANRETGDAPDKVLEPGCTEHQTQHKQHVIQPPRYVPHAFLDEGNDRRQGRPGYGNRLSQQTTCAEHLGAPGAVIEDQVGRVFLARKAGIERARNSVVVDRLASRIAQDDILDILHSTYLASSRGHAIHLRGQPPTENDPCGKRSHASIPRLHFERDFSPVAASGAKSPSYYLFSLVTFVPCSPRPAIKPF